MTIRLDSKYSEQTNTREFRKAMNLAYGQGGLNYIRDKYTTDLSFIQLKRGVEEGGGEKVRKNS